MVRIVLAAVDAPLADAWERFCGDLADVAVHRGSIFEVACDTVVSPANSFGFMDGGLDGLYLRPFGWVSSSACRPSSGSTTTARSSWARPK